MSPAVTSFLVAAVPECSHDPKVRVVRFLTGKPAPLPYASASSVASWLVDAALYARDERARHDLVDVLGNSNQPDLLDALELACWWALQYEKGHAQLPYPEPHWPYRLWEGKRPTVLTEILLTNPYLPRPLPRPLPPDPLPPDEDPSRYWRATCAPKVMLAILKKRLNRVPEFMAPRDAIAVRALIDGVGQPAAPADRCRHALASYLPSRERDALAFLFITGQWDRADPDGRLLRDYCARHAKNYHDTHRRWIEYAATVGNRPNPCPPRRDHPRPKSDRGRSRRGRTGPIGSWPTNPDGWSGDAGGGFGGSF